MPTFLLDLPVNINEKQTEVLPFLIQQEHASTSEEPEGKTKHWSMMLALDMENLGALQIKVSLSFDKIYVTIWSDDPDTKRLLETKDQSLKTALLSEQLTIGNIDYRQGLKENNIDTSTINLLDEKI